MSKEQVEHPSHYNQGKTGMCGDWNKMFLMRS